MTLEETYRSGDIEGTISLCLCAIREGTDDQAAYASNLLGVIRQDQGYLAAGEELIRAAVARRPGEGAYHSSLGINLMYQGRFAEAWSALTTGLGLAPQLPMVHLNLGIWLLLHGRYDAGLQEYEWRLQDRPPTPSALPWWRGEDLAGRTLLVRREQGLGDQLMLLRYAPLLRGGRVMWDVPERLRPLLEPLPPGVDGWARPGCRADVQVMSGSLPALLGGAIPEPLRLHLDPQPAPAPGLRVGVAWAGSSQYGSDRRRSVHPHYLLPLLEVPGVTFVNLQRQRQFPYGGMINPPLADQIAFRDTVAALRQVDLLITVDSVLGHLASCLGTPVWVALARCPHWIWGLRDSSPWYPATRLFRQRVAGDWSEVFGRMAQELRCLT